MSTTLLLLAADGILVLHTLFVAFVVLGQLLVFIGYARHWFWVRNPWFRIGHLAAIAVVVLQSWLGAACRLTIWEMALRSRAGTTVYSGDFIAHWLQSILYYAFAPRVFLVCYTVFGILVAASWWLMPPRGFAAGTSRRQD